MHLWTVSLARRFPVGEERTKGWRTRAIDDETEGGVNHTSGALFFLRQGNVPKFRKRDVKSAYRRAPIRRDDEEFCWFFFCLARLPLGSLTSWHDVWSYSSECNMASSWELHILLHCDQVQGLPVTVCGRLLWRFPRWRYDHWWYTSTHVLELLGLCTDPTKDNDDTLSLPVLGVLGHS